MIINDFYKLCEDSRFLDDDIFMETFELAKKLDEVDFDILKKDWSSFGIKMKENIIFSLHNSKVIDEKIKLAEYIFEENENQLSFNLFNQIREKTQNKKSRELYLSLALKLWGYSEYRKYLKQAIRITHNSNSFLEKLGFEKWNEIECKI